jgi:DNA replication initiation complex subunit (GINS family)
MKLTNINTSALRNLIKLTERKESLLNEIEKIESQLSSLLTGKAVRSTGKRRGRPAKGKKAGRPAKKKAGRPAKAKKAGRSGKRAPRGLLKKKIFAALKAAGDAGMKVTELSKKIGVKNANVHVWFSSTGKKIPEIKRVGKGHFKLSEK